MTSCPRQPAHGGSRTLAVLTSGIIPEDERDAGAASVDAGRRLAERMQGGLHADLYAQGLQSAERLAQELFAHQVAELGPSEVHVLLERLRTSEPVFFKQLRTDVATLYLSDAGVCARIGFPGPSLATGGYPDFDHPQREPGLPPTSVPRGRSGQ